MNPNPSSFTRRAVLGFVGGAVALSASALLAPTVASAAPAAALRVKVADSLVLQATPFTYAAGARVVLLGQIVSPKSGRTLYVQRYDTSRKVWVNVNASRVDEPHGFYSVAIKVTRSGTYRTFAPAAAGVAALSSRSTRVFIDSESLPTPTLKATVNGGDTVTFKLTDVQGKPVPNGVISVYAYAQINGEWQSRPLRVRTVTNRSGEATFRRPEDQGPASAYLGHFFATKTLNQTESGFFN